MKKSALFLGTLIISTCYAWQAINKEQYIKEAEAQLTENSLRLQEKIEVRLPVHSKASVGKINNKKITLINFSYPLFIIGDDAVSKEWLEKNTKELEKVHALGFVANIKFTTQLESLQKITQAPLLPANVDDLMSLFQESHYPLAFYESKLWQ